MSNITYVNRRMGGQASESLVRALVCVNVLQCVAVFCSVLQCAAVCCSVLQASESLVRAFVCVNVL